jgi:Zn-dependent M28 family amino/carboxypeptidase
MLAETIGKRNASDEKQLRALKRAEKYIETFWTQLGYEVVRNEYRVAKYHGAAQDEEFANLEINHKGSLRPDEIILVGAHYDSATITPGANDNGSGVAILLELSRLIKELASDRTIRFVAFANEEPPFFKQDTMGSLNYARRSSRKRENIAMMISLETLGNIRNTNCVQKKDFITPEQGTAYPDTCDFILFVSNDSTKEQLERALPLFRTHSAIKAFTFSDKDDVVINARGISWSDHWSFWKAGYHAIMVTDTAPMREPNTYHKENDIPVSVSYDSLVEVTKGLLAILVSKW